MLSENRVREMLDYATVYGEFDENTPNGTPCEYGEDFASTMNTVRRSAIVLLKKILGDLPEDYVMVDC